jgi:hypothetical protein
MRASTLGTFTKLFVILAAVTLLAGMASAQVNGAIFTTDSTGAQVNGNIYPSKDAVYLNGGPQNTKDPGLKPGDGATPVLYYFQVTDPSGAILLSTDDISCRQVVVEYGRIIGVPGNSAYGSQPTGAPAACTDNGSGQTTMHAIGTFDPANNEVPVQLIPYLDTPNNGGVYKAWLTPVADYGEGCAPNHASNGFCDKDSKTDNFKIRTHGSTTAFVTVCKFNDQNDDGVRDDLVVGDDTTIEPLIPHWPITATGVDGGTVNTQTDDSGCVSFSVSGIQQGQTQQVTLTEGTQGPDWTQTAPADGTCTLTGTVNAVDTCTVSGGVITLTLSPSDDANAPNFGNFNPNCTTGCSGNQVIVTKDANPIITYPWTIKKSVDKTEIDTAPGGNTTFNYTVDVSHDAGTATMTGTIRVSNATDADINNVLVSDAVSDAAAPDGGACTVEAGPFHDGTGTVPAGSHVDVMYACTFTGLPAAGPNTNKATATWDSSSASGTASFDFSAATIKDGSVTVTDPLGGGTLGTASYTQANPIEFTYSYSVPGTSGTCVTQNNTATFTAVGDPRTTGSSNTVTVKVCEGADLTVSKNAIPTFTRAYNWNISKIATPAEIDSTSGGSAKFQYTVSVNETAPTDSAWALTGTIMVTNLNDWEAITTNNVTEMTGCSVTGGAGASIPAGESISLSYSCSLASGASGTNIATATWSGGYTPDSLAQGSAAYAFATPTTPINQTITPTDAFNGGSAVNLCTLASGTPCTLTATDPPAAPTTQTYTYSRPVTAPTSTCTTLSNTAATGLTGTGQTSSQSVKVCGGSDLSVSKTATPSFTRTYNWTISKSATPSVIDTTSGSNANFNYSVTASETGFIDSGWQVSGTITVTNPNKWESISTTVKDSLDTGSNCTYSPSNTPTVPSGGSSQVGYVCTLTSATGGMNYATATWSAATYYTPDGSATNAAGVAFTFTTPTTPTNKTITPTDTFNGGNPVTLCTLAASTPCTLTATDSAPYTSQIYKYSRTVTAPTGTCATYNNTAATGLTGTGQTSSQSVKVCGASNLTVSKTALAGYTPGITKTFNGSSPVEASGSTTLKYTITVTESGWNVAGIITVTNPNDWEAIPVNLSDVLSDTKGSCAITGGNSQTVPLSSSITPAYSCAFSGAPAANGTNTAAASWNAATSFTSLGSASGQASYGFALLTVTDTFNGGTPKTLGSNLVPAASYTFTDSYTVTETGGSCVTYPNTATIVNGPSASQTVTVCNTKTGALTMGFWQNKNGQAIITNSGPKTGTCTITSWLRAYNPFNDLSVTATCAQVGTYVTNIIKAANASGAAMNAMLKAQMLATALDVYFSDPLWGGDKVAGYNGGITTKLGGVKIDLTKVCGMIDSSSGTGTCSGTYLNAGPAFGGATSMTVLQILAYAASQSNAGGTSWYGQVKATQGLAKNTFDAINNQAAQIAP